MWATVLRPHVAPAAAQDGPRAPGPDRATMLDVMSFNIRFDNPDDGPDAWPERRRDVAALIRTEAPDLVGLQEALRSQLDDLAAALPEYDWLGEGRSREERGNEYSAILYRRDRLRVMESGTFWLSETPHVPYSRGWDAALERVATWARFEIMGPGHPTGTGGAPARILHLNTHFDHRGEQARLESARLIARWTRDHSGGDPVVATGDLNTLPGTAPIAALTDAGLQDAFSVATTPHHGPTGTWNGFEAVQAERRIDYVFADASIGVKKHAILPGKRPNGRFVSDHLPVVARLVLGRRAPANDLRQGHAVIPHPRSVEMPASGQAAPFLLDERTAVLVHMDAALADGPGTSALGTELERLAAHLRSWLGTSPPANVQAPAIHLALVPRAGNAPRAGGALDEAYRLEIHADAIRLEAATPAGLFYGMQTLVQWLPAEIEHSGLSREALAIAPVSITDAPRFAWRGAMLDVARHFFGPKDVKRYLDLMSRYKMNRLHLHLSDDQGWRIDIPGRPELTRIGAQTGVGGGTGGYYSMAEYEDLVRYAAERYITIVPEIDMPGHTNAALASTPELNCDGKAPPLYTGMNVGFSTLCVEKEETYAFVEDVVREISARTPGAWFHIGGDEVQELSADAYRCFMRRAEDIVTRHGKRLVAWDEVAEVGLGLADGALVQVWRPQTEETRRHLRAAHARGARFILSPANHIYLDMKYNETSRIGLSWAGLTSVRAAYEWEPADLVQGIPEHAIEGIEAPLWTETAETMNDLEWLAFPRIVGAAELGWSARHHLRWESYARRLAAHAPRWRALDIDYYPSPLIDWQ